MRNETIRHSMGTAGTVVLLALAVLSFGCEGTSGLGGGGDACQQRGLFCPAGFVCHEPSATCHCDGSVEDVCGEGAMCDLVTGQCVCATDDCCDDGHVFDRETAACVCASTECCPDGYAYDDEAGICVCVIEICCPVGFELGDDGRCLCESDEACGEGFTCDLETGDCRCQNNEACGEELFCNDFGFCQERAACSSSFDCPENHVCDFAQGFCLSGYCAIDADCPLGRLCENNGCRRGCRSSDDCWLAEACIDGHCRGHICDRDSQCGISENCVDGKCVRDTDRHCQMPCNPASISSGCASNAHCVTQMVEGQAEPYCAVECDPDVGCPNGYYCGGVLVTGCQTGTDCRMSYPHLDECLTIMVHRGGGTPEEVKICGTGGRPAAAFHTCGPVFGSCAHQPAPGETTRPGPGNRCDTLCRDGLICANAGTGYRCYAPCSDAGTCAGSHVCKPAPNNIDKICVPA